MDIIKGIVLKELTTQLNDITDSNAALYEIIRITYNFIHLATTKFWGERCTKMIKEECYLGITSKQKRISVDTQNDFTRSYYIDDDMYSFLPDTIVGDQIMDLVVSTNNHFSNFYRGLDLAFKFIINLIRIFCQILGW